MNDYRKSNGISVYHSCIIFLFLIIVLSHSASAADTMFRGNAEHTGVFDDSEILPTITELWRFKCMESARIVSGIGFTYTIEGRSSPAVSNGVVYVGSNDNNLYSIDSVTGIEKWRFKTGSNVASSPAVSNGVIYVGSLDNNLYAIDGMTGTEKWRFHLNRRYSPTSPVVSNGIIYDCVDMTLYAIDAVTGTEKWRFTTDNSIGPLPAVSNGFIYIESWNNLHAIDAVTGKEKWRFKTGGDVTSSPAVSNGTIYVGSRDKNLYAIDAITGTEKWQFKTEDIVTSSPVVSNGVIYFGSDDGYLHAVGVPTSQENTQTTAPAQTITPNSAEDTTNESTPLWDRNILVYLILVVFVVLFGALVYDTYYKKKK